MFHKGHFNSSEKMSLYSDTLNTNVQQRVHTEQITN